MLLKLKDTIALFEWCSGHQVNWEKLALHGVNEGEENLQSMAEKLSCKAAFFSVYLPRLTVRRLPKASVFLATSDWQSSQEARKMEEV